jgi:hypothetical protein
MDRKGALLATCFCAGALGALAAGAALWGASHWGWIAAAGIDFVPEFSLDWLYQYLVWGGIWGLPFYLAVSSHRRRRHWIRKGLWLSLLPSAHQLFYVFPHLQDAGMMGMELGHLTPLVILLINFLWGAVTGVWIRILWGRG